MIDLNKPEMVGYLSPHAEWKRELIRDFGRRFNIRAFIETGTCWGTTVGAVLSNFDEIKSVEVELKFFNFASEKYKGFSNVALYYGSSAGMLPMMIEQTKRRPILFWLDAHITGGSSINLGDQIPGELKAIDELAPDSIVLIDDVKPAQATLSNPAACGFDGPDGPIVLPPLWHGFFYHGVLALQKGTEEKNGLSLLRYKFPLTF